MIKLKYKRATGLIYHLLVMIKMGAIVMPNGVCYVTLPLPLPLWLQRHEAVHWEQYNRHGRLLFVIMYLVELMRRGYWNNKFEIEARKAEEE